MGKSTGTLSINERVVLGILTLAKMILTAGLIFLFSENARSDGKSFFTGKEVVVVYGCSELWKTQILENESDTQYEIYIIGKKLIVNKDYRPAHSMLDMCSREEEETIQSDEKLVAESSEILEQSVLDEMCSREEEETIQSDNKLAAESSDASVQSSLGSIDLISEQNLKKNMMDFVEKALLSQQELNRELIDRSQKKDEIFVVSFGNFISFRDVETEVLKLVTTLPPNTPRDVREKNFNLYREILYSEQYKNLSKLFFENCDLDQAYKK